MYFLTRPDFITTELETEFQNYCITVYPNEACAFVIGGKLVPVKNIHSDPQNHFSLSATDNKKFVKAEAFLHSHPDGDMEPSEGDMMAQIAAGIPFGICMNTSEGAERILWWGDHLLDHPLEERPFISGAYDCYEMVRSVYWQQKNIKLPNFPRENDWWNTDRNVIEEYLDKSGFSETTDTPKEYDVFGMSFVSSQKISHLAVRLDDQTIIHHLESGVSKIDYSVRYAKFIKKVYRYNG